ncbi:MAG TPA: antibiotic biosynthesis monooxygenase [Candidatus Acidoferrales bacterium]|nr:antibiotic biosynthesis monooxygenase [Candidatus Acidoferrales bacterium]
MLILIVHAQVKPEFVDAFIAASRINATESAKEPGVARFDFLQQQDDPTRFVIHEVYRNAEAPAKHKETPHYLAWNEKTAEMLVAPRTRAWYTNLVPGDAGY